MNISRSFPLVRESYYLCNPCWTQEHVRNELWQTFVKCAHCETLIRFKSPQSALYGQECLFYRYANMRHQRFIRFFFQDIK